MYISVDQLSYSLKQEILANVPEPKKYTVQHVDLNQILSSDKIVLVPGEKISRRLGFIAHDSTYSDRYYRIIELYSKTTNDYQYKENIWSFQKKSSPYWVYDILYVFRESSSITVTYDKKFKIFEDKVWYFPSYSWDNIIYHRSLSSAFYIGIIEKLLEAHNITDVSAKLTKKATKLSLEDWLVPMFEFSNENKIQDLYMFEGEVIDLRDRIGLGPHL